MSAVVFAGPSLPPASAPAIGGLEWRPPVRQGDVYKAALARPAIIGILDGYFEVVPTVWHKEILWAMAQGIHVYGAASIGALRAAELVDYGMKGIGEIFEKFRASVLEDDDEVAVLHGPEEVGYVQVTEAMVNIRATVAEALRAGIMTEPAAAALIQAAKSLFYKDRTYELIVEKAAGMGPHQHALRRFTAWLPSGQVDQKRRDALAMVEAIEGHLRRGVSPMKVSYEFADTIAWEEARERAERDLVTRR